MKRLILAILLVAITASTALADRPDKIGFRAYSSASSITCGVFGGKAVLTKDTNGHPIQGHAPNTTYARTYLLGTKGFVNHSTAGQASVAFTCTVTGSTTTAPVKVFMNGVETYFLTTDKDIYVIGQ
jgi:hypothetical protein